MPTYTLPTVFLRDAAAGSGSGYPLYIYSTTYSPDVSLYIKDEDVIQIPVSNAADAQNGNSAGTDTSCSYAGSHDNATPDPAESGNRANGSLWTLTVDKDMQQEEGTSGNTVYAWADHFTTWYYFADGGDRTVRAHIRLVAVASLSSSASNVVQGNSLTFTANTITGLNAPSGANGNKLYISVWDSSGARVTATGSSGLTWTNGTGALGHVTTSATSDTCTFGSSMTTGTYTVAIGHYGGNFVSTGGGAVTNAFYGTAHRLATCTVQVDSSSGTVTWASDLGSDIDAGTDLDYSTSKNTGVITIDPTSYAAPISVSGTGNPKYRRRNSSLQYVDPVGGINTSGNTVGHGWDVTFYMDGPDDYSESTTGTLTTGGRSDSLTISTGAAPDTTPDAFDSGLGANQTGVALNTTVTSSAATITGINQATAVTVSGDGNPQFKIGSGSYGTSGNVSNNETVTLRFTSANAYSTQRTATLTIGGVTGQVTATTTAPPAPYGLQVFNENGNTEIFGYNVRGGHFIATGTISSLAVGATSVVAAEGMTSSNTANVVIGFNDEYKGSITRGTNQVTFTNTHSAAITFTYHILRL